MKTAVAPGLTRVPIVTATKLYGGLDARSPEVIACERRWSQHKWVSFVVGQDDFEDFPVTICARCCVRRCEVAVKRSDPLSMCMYPTGHSVAHRDGTGYWREVS